MKLLLKRGIISVFSGAALLNLSACDPFASNSDLTVIRYQTNDHFSAVQVNADEIISSHNQWRSEVGVPPLRWSNKMAQYAQQWANHLKTYNNCKMQHRPSSSPYGENLYWASPTTWSDGRFTIQSISSTKVVDDWGSEVSFYNYQRNSCRPGEQCGHYTQMVWRSTRSVGCAAAVCNDKSQVWVCNYDPPGNYVGQRPY